MIRLKEKVCVTCHQSFSYAIKRGADRNHCSLRCRRNSANERRRIKGIREKGCLSCGQAFQYQIGRGVDRKYCSDECVDRATSERKLYRQAHAAPCKTPGCGNRAEYSDGICNSCFYRRKRTGTTEARQWRYKYQRKDGYIALYEPSHPLASKDGYITEHRVALYETLGPGEQACYWCATPLEWKRICVDHLNEEKADNRPENLVAACNQCNRARGAVLPFLAGLNDLSFQAFIRSASEYRAKVAELNGRDDNPKKAELQAPRGG